MNKILIEFLYLKHFISLFWNIENLLTSKKEEIKISHKLALERYPLIIFWSILQVFSVISCALL